MKNYGDNIVSTFGVDSNPSTLIARCFHNLRDVDTTWAQNELGWLTACFGDPREGEIYIHPDDTFEGICEALKERGWYLYDWTPSFPAETVDRGFQFGQSDLVKVTFESSISDARCSMRVLGAEVPATLHDFEASGLWVATKMEVIK